MIDAEAWRKAVKASSGQSVTSVLAVQCALDWLLPESKAIRDEIDQAITELALSGRGLPVNRIILHNVPAIRDLSPGEFSRLNEAHADWTYRLSVVADFIPVASRPRVHRLIVDGGPNTVKPVDGIETQIKGRWEHPEAAAAALHFVQGGGTTPLTSYDIDRDGPFGDADPSVYL
jgi:hypothetical protein